jgi:CheY-like chemotaxis protein
MSSGASDRAASTPRPDTSPAQRIAEAERRAAEWRQLATTMLESEQRERRRLMDTLHKGLQTHLAAACERTAELQQQAGAEGMRRTVAELRAILENCLAESHFVIAELGPPIRYEADLSAALSWLAEHMRDKHAMAVVVQLDLQRDIGNKSLVALLFACVRQLLLEATERGNSRSAAVSLQTSEDDRLTLTVTDHGTGPRQGWTPDRQPAGISLFPMRERLKLFDGSLTVAVVPEAGMRVTIRVPAEPKGGAPVVARRGEGPPAAKPSGGSKEPSTVGGARPIRVLLVDDHPILRKGMADVLRDSAQIEVIGEAGDGFEAVEMANRMRPDVVLMDVSMPRLSGVEATERILAAMPAVRVIGLSMHEEEHMVAAMRAAGAVAYLTKNQAAQALVNSVLAARP